MHIQKKMEVSGMIILIQEYQHPMIFSRDTEPDHYMVHQRIIIRLLFISMKLTGRILYSTLLKHITELFSQKGYLKVLMRLLKIQLCIWISQEQNKKQEWQPVPIY